MKRPLGKLTPWIWGVELVRGCNLRCWHCTARKYEHQPRFMTFETWEAMCKVIAAISPHRRMEIAQSGEPTLHPHILEFLKIAKEITPTTQIQVTTNGINLLAGKITFNQLFDAGAHLVYVDMYAPLEKFISLANESGVDWYKYDKKTLASNPDHRIANVYYNDPNMRLIVLQDHPDDRIGWRKSGRLSTFLNHVDFDVSMQHGLVPVREPYHRRCTMPLRFSTVNVDGNYLFCCVDFWCETAGHLGNVASGVDGYLKQYWFSKLMQLIRKHIKVGDREKIPYCSRCNCAFAKCDWTHIWPDESYEKYLDGDEWKSISSITEDEEKALFASGWEWYRRTNEQLPLVEKEKEILEQSQYRIINSDKTVRQKQRKVKKDTNGQLFVKNDECDNNDAEK